MNKIYLACTIEENNKYYSFVEVINSGNNLIPMLERHKNLKTAHICSSRKNADQIVIEWNSAYKNNGTYLFDSPNF